MNPVADGTCKGPSPTCEYTGKPPTERRAQTTKTGKAMFQFWQSRRATSKRRESLAEDRIEDPIILVCEFDNVYL
jgi:hypothetical protein